MRVLLFLYFVVATAPLASDAAEQVNSLEAISASLNVLGIVVSGFSGPLGAVPLLISAILTYIQQGQQTTSLSELARDQKRIMNGIKILMKELQNHNLTDPVEAGNRISRLYDSMSQDRCKFASADEVNAENFITFASTHLAVNEIVIWIKNNSQHYIENRNTNLYYYSRYARFAMHKITSTYQWNENDDPTLPASVIKLEEHFEKWTSLLPTDQQQKLRNFKALPNGINVGFKVAGGPNYKWLSCWDTYAYCTLRTCPGIDNPMNGCLGERFKLISIDPPDSNGYVKSCSRFGIYYTYYRSMYMWLSSNMQIHQRSWWDRIFKGAEVANAEVRSCPGYPSLDVPRFRAEDCSWEAWIIKAVGKPCGSAIEDRDLIELENVHFRHGPIVKEYNYRQAGKNGRARESVKSFHKKFVIFRSDVSYDDISSGLQCVARKK